MRIQNINLIEINGWVKIRADVKWGKSNNQYKEVFFAVPNELKNRLDAKYADNFVVGLMLLAVKYNEDIFVEGAKLSPTLKKNLETKLFPIFKQMKCGDNKTRIISDEENIIDQVRGNVAATGISLGVDSFYSILKYKDNKEAPVRCVLYIKQVTDEICMIDYNADGDIIKRKEAAAKLGIEFIPMLSNLRSILDSEYVFSQYHTFAHLSAAMTINSISCYYYATGFSEKEMKLCFSDTAYYDNYIQDAVRHKCFFMRMAGSESSRFEKTQTIKENKVVQEYLEVCFHPYNDGKKITNCTKCHKCNRTLTTLDVLRSVSAYSSVFNIDYYWGNRGRAWGEIEYGKIIIKDEFSIEISREAKDTRFKLPSSRWIYFIKIGIQNQYNKLKNRIKS